MLFVDKLKKVDCIQPVLIDRKNHDIINDRQKGIHKKRDDLSRLSWEITYT